MDAPPPASRLADVAGSVCGAVYRALLLAYPARFRAAHGDEAVQMFADACREDWMARGPMSVVRRLAASVATVPRHGIVERVTIFPVRRKPAAFVPVSHDLRDGWRSLRRSPWYAGTSIAVLSLGIALSSLTFAVVDGVLFKPLPYPRADELFLIRADASSTPRRDASPVSWDEIDAWRAGVPDIPIAVVSATVDRDERLAGVNLYSATVDEQFLDVFGTRLLAGGFAPGDWDWRVPGSRSTERPQLISHDRWIRMYDADPGVVGRTRVRTDRNGSTYAVRIAGVLPPGFLFPAASGQPAPDVIAPLPRSNRLIQGASYASARRYYAFTRVRGAAEAARVRQRLQTATQRLAQRRLPTSAEGHHSPAALAEPFDHVRLVPIGEHLGRGERPAFALAMTASGLLLVLACLNVAGLVVARTLQRRNDTALRLALGASRWLIVRGQMVELALLAAPSAGLALLASGPLLDRTVALLPDSMALLKTPAIDLRVLAAATISAVLSLCVLTLWAARISGRPPYALGAWRSSSSAVPARSGRVVLAGLVGLGFVLVAAASLTSASLASAWAEDTGYARDRLALIETYASFYDTPAEAVDQLESVRARLAGTPGVEEVAVASIQPLFESESVSRGGGAPEPGTIVTRLVTSNYFRVMGLELVEGSWPRADEWTRDARVAIISQSAARAWFPGVEAVGGEIDGSRIRLPEGSAPLEVVGVVRDARYIALDQAPMRDVYRPGPIAVGTYGVFFVVRTTGAADALVPEFLEVTSDHRMTVTQAITIRDALFRSVRARAFSAWLFGLLGTAGVGILAIGIFGALASEADRRRREIGIRTAFGASAPRVVRQFVLEQAPWVAGGLLAGAVVTFWAAAFIESRLYGVGAREPALLFVTAIVVLSTALCGIVVPALRAARVDPVVALRAEG